MPNIILALIASLLPLLSLAGTVDVNSADAETIASSLEGIGPARARAIVQYRQQTGPFARIEDLLNVAGIGEQILDANRERITLGAPPAAD